VPSEAYIDALNLAAKIRVAKVEMLRDLMKEVTGLHIDGHAKVEVSQMMVAHMTKIANEMDDMIKAVKHA